MDKNIIQDIIIKSILEEASSEELSLLSNWREESFQNEQLYKEYVTVWNASANYESVDFQSSAETAYHKHLDLLKDQESKVINLSSNGSNGTLANPQAQTRFFTLRRMASLAALFVVALGAMVVFKTLNTTSISADQNISFVTLEDGTSLWLDEGSSISYSNGFGKDHRNLNLDGKAFFDVHRDESLAFIIASNDIQVAVLGTSFTVDTKDGKNIVAVKTGKVSVKADKEEVILEVDDKVIYENNAFTQLKASEEDILWRNKNLSFDNAPLNQVIADINLFHDNKIVLKNDSKELDCPFTARSLANTSFDNIIEILEITYDLKSELQENGSVLLTISECK
jgi:ferric-dicitrate binding protein FerR (iron transport regulator)